jgi:uncharacterized YigZ family protein
LKPDSRFVPQSPATAEVVERGSRFLAFAQRADSPEAARSTVAELSKRFHDATHVCYAWRIGAASRAADSGEPAGTAGRRILAAIDSAGLDETLVAVVRWFGGTKLGTAGLARCYAAATREALAAAGRREVFETEALSIGCPYAKLARVKRILAAAGVEAKPSEFGETVKLLVEVRKSRVEDLRRALAAERVEISG